MEFLLTKYNYWIYAVIMMVGLYGQGKTTTTAKLAKYFQKRGLKVGLIAASSDPAEHSATVAIDPVPHDLANESTNLLETLDSIEFRHANGVFIPAHLADKLSPKSHVRLSRTSPEARIRLHLVHQDLEVARWDLEVEIELADKIEIA